MGNYGMKSYKLGVIEGKVCGDEFLKSRRTLSQVVVELIFFFLVSREATV